MSSTYKREGRRLRIQRDTNGKYKLVFEEKGKSGRILGTDMDTRDEAVRRKAAYAKTYGVN